MRIHTTKDGAKIKLCDMTDSHLAATIRMMERKASEGIIVRTGSGLCPDDFCYDENCFYGETALEYMGYADYVKERDDRREERTVNALVRQFIVQERFNEGEWMDDPDQPDDYAHGFEQAKWWMENDNKTCMGHETTYEHRIVERTETQVWPNAKLRCEGTLAPKTMENL